MKVDVGKSNETDVDQEKTEVRKRSRSREEDRRRKDAKRTSRSPDPRRRRSRSPSKQDDKKIWVGKNIIGTNQAIIQILLIFKPTNREWDRGKDLDKSSGKTEEKSRNRRSVSPDRKGFRDYIMLELL